MNFNYDQITMNDIHLYKFKINRVLKSKNANISKHKKMNKPISKCLLRWRIGC